MQISTTHNRTAALGAWARTQPRLVLVNHGASASPVKADPPLSPLGRSQAEALAARFSAGQFDVLYTSPQRCTRETAAILGARLGLQPVPNDALRRVQVGPAAFLQVVALARHMRLDRRALLVTHEGTLRLLLVALEGWRRLPWLWRPVPLCQPIVCRPQRPALDLRAPLWLLLAGLLLGLAAAPGPWPHPLTALSVAFALGVFWLGKRLTARGYGARAASVLIAAALVFIPLAFGPDPVPHRKVTAFNAWAYELGAHLPAIVLPAPNPNAVAGVLCIALALAGAIALYAHRWRRLLGILLTLLIGAALALTASRTGWVAGAAALFVVAAGRGRRQAMLALSACGLAIAALVVIAPPMRSIADLAIRSALWHQTLELLAVRPFTGLGIGRLAANNLVVASAFGAANLQTPHNALLQLWVDGGLLGLAAVGLAAWRLVRHLYGAESELRDRTHWLRAGLEGALLAFVVQSFFETNTIFIWQTTQAIHLLSPLPWALLGMLAGLSQREEGAARVKGILRAVVN